MIHSRRAHACAIVLAAACLLLPLQGCDGDAGRLGPRLEAAALGGPGSLDASAPEVSTRPRLVNPEAVLVRRAASFPAALRRPGVNRAVVVRLHIDEAGAVERVEVERSSATPAVEEAALEVASVMRFTPAERDGAPVPVTMRWTVAWPLVVVDGEPRPEVVHRNQIDGEIVSIEILEGEEARDAYGEWATGGVVELRTRGG